MKIFAPAKLNLCLDIIKKDSSGYHEMRTIFFEHKELKDELEFYATSQESKLSTLHAPQIPAYPKISKEENLIMKAVRLIQKRFNISKQVEIKVQKNIPYSSGMGGGARGATATLKALNELWGLNLAPQELEVLGAEIGMDVPFFIQGGLALGTHYGEKITPISTNLNLKFEVQPHQAPKEVMDAKTKDAFNLLDLSKCNKSGHLTDRFLDALKNNDPNIRADLFHNDFETIFPTSKGRHLSGAGPTTFTFLGASLKTL